MLYLGQAVEITKFDKSTQRGVFLGMKYVNGNFKKAAVAIFEKDVVVETEVSLGDVNYLRCTDLSSPTGKSIWTGDCCTKIMSDSMVLKIPEGARKVLEQNLA